MNLIYRMPVTVAVMCGLLNAMLLSAHPAWCDETTLTPETPEWGRVVPGTRHEPAQAALYTGYRFVTPSGDPSTAAPYIRQKSGVSAGFSAGMTGEELKFSGDAQFLHADSYNAELFLDYAGIYRLRIDSGAVWHNLERLAPATADSVKSLELDKGAGYGIRTNISSVNNRFKLGNYPVHLNIGYWQLTREGNSQLRFSDYNFDAFQNSVVTRSVVADSVTREGSAGVDAHAGPLNAAYTFTIRDFSNRAPDIRDVFVARSSLAAGTQVHDTPSDSRVTSHIFKLYSDLSGGLAASALYSLVQRETNIDRGDARPSSAPSDTLQTMAGDVSYTPFSQLSLSLKYRRLQIERDSPATVSSPFSLTPAGAPSQVFTATPGILTVRPSSDSVKDTLILSGSYRPLPHAIYRVEYRAELESRNDLPDFQTPVNPGSLKSDHRQTHTGKASFFWKPFNAAKFNASYSYSARDNPAYLSSYSERHIGQAQLSYASRGRWGLAASYMGRFESGESSSFQTRLPRESLTTSVNGSAWFNPAERMTVTASYCFMRSAVEQTSLYYSSFAPVATLASYGNYRSSAHYYAIDAVLAIARTVDLSLAFQQTFSDVRLSASDNSQSPQLTSSGIGEKSRLSSTGSALTARLDWRLSKYLGAALGYSFRTYEPAQGVSDASLHETLLAFTGRW